MSGEQEILTSCPSCGEDFGQPYLSVSRVAQLPADESTATAVADAVRAERERVERAVRGFDFAPDLPDGDPCRVADMNAARDRLADFIAALPADGNTKQEC